MLDAVDVENVAKAFRRTNRLRPRTLKETLLRGWHQRARSEIFWALNDISFTVAPGIMLGIIGNNGAGKSTLLRLIGGVGIPDRGQITVRGRIGALLDLGAGFHPDLTGRENVYVNGAIAGLTRREIDECFDPLVAFAGLERFIDSPFRTYSSGMQMRLAFAVAIHTDPDVLLIDEVLAVGDFAFQRKCVERISLLKANGCAVIFVSHDTTQIKQLCDKAIWLRAGQIAARGIPETVVDRYLSEAAEETRRRTPGDQPALLTSSGAKVQVQQNRFGSLELQITGVHLFDSSGTPVAELKSGAELYVHIDYRAPQPIPNPIFGVYISREDNLDCVNLSTAETGFDTGQAEGEGRISLRVDHLDLTEGRYFVDVGAYERNWSHAYDYHWHVYPLTIRGSVGKHGILCPPHQWSAPAPKCLDSQTR
jgi:lipopolysaccharide transport system ATP-binding protein